MQSKCTPSNALSTIQTSTANNLLHVPAERFKELCLRPGGEFSKDTLSILDNLFNPEKQLNSFNCDVELIKTYLTGGISFDLFKNKLKTYDNSSVCGLVWNVSYVAYRCRTCALSPCMSICADCFKNGDHTGHDYNMFRSGAGGACDCGDEYVMNPKGFCKFHGPSKQLNQIQPPEDLTKCCQVILSHLLYRLLQFFRTCFSMSDFKTPSNKHILNAMINEMNPYIDLLNDLCSLGTALRKILVDYLISEDFYQKKIKSESNNESESIEQQNDQEKSNNPDRNNKKLNCLKYQYEIYIKSLNMLECIQLPELFKEKQNDLCKLEHKNMVDEFLFWSIQYEFPENLVKFLLSLLPDLRYKMIFIKSFVSQYSYISVFLLNSKSEHLSSRVVHISVQLFSNEAIAIKALEEFNLLPIVLSTLHNMIVNPKISNTQDLTQSENLLIKNKLENEKTNHHLVVDPDHSILQENLYWLVISDLVNLLTHRNLALVFLSNKDWCKLWLELVEYFQTMNLNIRKFGEHVPQENPTYFSSFSAELEFCASIMWSFIQHLQSKDQLELSKSFINQILDTLKSWLSKIGLIQFDSLSIKRPNFKHLSFHLPLNRYLSTFLYNSLFNQSACLADLFDEYFKNNNFDEKEYFLLNLLAYPLQLQIGYYEIHANMWVRNGMQMKGQAMTYVQNHFCSSFNDSDLFLIQVLASKLNPDVFARIFFERFHITKWLKCSILKRLTPTENKEEENKPAQTSTSDNTVISVVEEMLDEINQETNTDNVNSEPTQDPTDPDELETSHQTAMLIGSLTALAQILMVNTNLRLKSYLLTRKEIVYLLTVTDRTFSQVEESLPDICSLSSGKKFIQPILSQISDYLQPSLDVLSISNLKQGRYKPKDSIWLSEYDPLYVMLRSVKRREFQESFDRYCSFAERKISSTPKKNLWPPFRLPDTDFKNLEPISNLNLNQIQDFDILKEIENDKKLDNELKSKWNLLNTKILHVVLLNILYEHYYTSPVNEKILYFVVYLLELGIHYELKASNENTWSNKQEINYQFKEDDYETWFKTNKLSDNLNTFVTFSKYERNESTAVKRSQSPDSIKNVQTNQTILEEEEQTQTSYSQSQTNPPQKRICSSTSPSRPKAYSSSNDEPMNIETEKLPEFKKVAIHESILSLLVKIVYKNKTNENDKNKLKNFKLEFEFLNKTENQRAETKFDSWRIGDENDFIINLLEKASKLNEKCSLNIEKTLETLNLMNKQTELEHGLDKNVPKTSFDQTSPSIEDDLKNKKLKAKARQQKLLAQMSSGQKAFLQNPVNKEEVEAFEKITPNEPKPSSSIDTIDFNKNIVETESDLLNEAKEKSVLIEHIEEVYDCCICCLSTTPTAERPVGLVALLQSTSILGYRESTKVANPIKKLPLSDTIDSNDLITDTCCWKQEEKRVKNLTEAFSIDSCKYSINIGWKGGIYAQMCGHYVHFDCFNLYKQTLDEQLTHLPRTSSVEFTCPVCRQLANCVLPVALKNLPKTQKVSSDIPTTSSEAKPIISTLANTPAKLWIMSSLANKQNLEKLQEAPNDKIEYIEPGIFNDKIYMNILNILKNRRFFNPETNSKALTQCKNDALTIITLTTPIEFRYIDHTLSISNPSWHNSRSPVDDDIAMFTTSVIRTQLEIDLMLLLKQQSQKYSSQFQQQTEQKTNESFFIANSFNFKKKKSCFLPLIDVISTHCRLMCHESKPHVKQWLMLINPSQSSDVNKFMFIIGAKASIDNNEDLNTQEDEIYNIKSKIKKSTKLEILEDEVPILLKDPIASLLLIVINLPFDTDKSIFNTVVSSVFNLVYIQSIIDLLRQFDDEEKGIWSENPENSKNPSFKNYLSYIIKFFKDTNILKPKSSRNNSSEFFIKTIWTLESAKNYVETKCLHFLKISSLLQSYLYNQEISNDLINSFGEMIKFLNISSSENNQSFILKWAVNKPYETIDFWLEELLRADESNHHEQIENLLSLSFDQYHFPQLLELPYLYSELFSYFLNKKCQYCSKIPRETAVCLLCGTQVCYKSNYCCDSMKDSNKKHMNLCGAGTLILLNINSTYVFVFRGKRCAPWASLYLDEHGEEDRDLRRGKPLYLNEQRFNLLKSSWYSHTFDYQSLKWYNSSLFIY